MNLDLDLLTTMRLFVEVEEAETFTERNVRHAALLHRAQKCDRAQTREGSQPMDHVVQSPETVSIRIWDVRDLTLCTKHKCLHMSR